jgi:hypothetical protein
VPPKADAPLVAAASRPSLPRGGREGNRSIASDSGNLFFQFQLFLLEAGKQGRVGRRALVLFGDSSVEASMFGLKSRHMSLLHSLLLCSHLDALIKASRNAFVSLDRDGHTDMYDNPLTLYL